MRSFNKISLCGSSLVTVASLLVTASPALAQSESTTSAASGQTGSDIIVTARKREEDILKTPVTVTALTGAMLDQRGIKSMTDLTSSTPGINMNNSTAGHADRSFQQIVIRGMMPSDSYAATTSLFIDGVPLSSPSAFTAITNPARIEILKGPQSAYFGRNTFAGAVNVVNADPSDTWKGEMLGSVGTRSNWRLRGSIEGPIIGDMITFRASAEKWSKDGSWKNYGPGGGTLGDQSSTMGTLLIDIKPSDKLKIRLFGLLGKDEDGPSAQSRLYGYDVKNSSGQVIEASQSNCTLTGSTTGVQGQGSAVQNNWFCGTLPSLGNQVSVNTVMTPNSTALVQNSVGRVVSPDDTVDHYGLLRYTQHAHATVDYEINDQLSLSVLGGYNHERWTTLIDLDGYDSSSVAGNYPNGYFDFPYLIERNQKDWSAEGRLNYDFGALHGVVGVSYIDAIRLNGLGSGLTTVTASTMSPSGKAENKTLGGYFGATYDFTSRLSLSVEGRYQIDKLYSFAAPSGVTVASSEYIPAGYYAGGSILAQGTYRNFTPRVIVNFQATPDLMVYASWSKGVNPSQFNTTIVQQNATIQAAAKAAGMSLTVKPEKLTNYEIGAKGKLFGGRMSYSLDAYYAQWRDQLTSILLTLPNGTYTNGSENVSFINGYANAGSVDLYGVELQTNWNIGKLLSVDAAGAYTGTHINSFTSPTISALTGIYDYSGNQMPMTSKWSANVGAQVGGNVKGQADTTWFLRGEWNFKSGFYSDQANLAKTTDSHVFNARIGASWGNKSLQAYVTNIFNNKAYTSVSDNYTITSNYAYLSRYSALVVGLPDLRTAGVQFQVKF